MAIRYRSKVVSRLRWMASQRFCQDFSPTRIHVTKTTVNGVDRTVKTLFCDNPNCATALGIGDIVVGYNDTVNGDVVIFGILTQLLDAFFRLLLGELSPGGFPGPACTMSPLLRGWS